MHIEDSKLVIKTGHKTFHFDLLTNVLNNLKYKIDSIIKYEIFAEHLIKNKISQLLSK